MLNTCEIDKQRVHVILCDNNTKKVMADMEGVGFVCFL